MLVSTRRTDEGRSNRTMNVQSGRTCDAFPASGWPSGKMKGWRRTLDGSLRPIRLAPARTPYGGSVTILQDEHVSRRALPVDDVEPGDARVKHLAHPEGVASHVERHEVNDPVLGSVLRGRVEDAGRVCRNEGASQALPL